MWNVWAQIPDVVVVVILQRSAAKVFLSIRKLRPWTVFFNRQNRCHSWIWDEMMSIIWGLPFPQATKRWLGLSNALGKRTTKLVWCFKTRWEVAPAMSLSVCEATPRCQGQPYSGWLDNRQCFVFLCSRAKQGWQLDRELQAAEIGHFRTPSHAASHWAMGRCVRALAHAEKEGGVEKSAPIQLQKMSFENWSLKNSFWFSSQKFWTFANFFLKPSWERILSFFFSAIIVLGSA